MNECQQTLDGGTALINEDHPGFHDKEYRARRSAIVNLAYETKFGQEIPLVDYTDEETRVWGIVYNNLKKQFDQYACDELLEVFPSLEKNCGYAPDNIPQLRDISDHLFASTGFRLKPIAGLVSARDFLNCLAYRVFVSTQYIRHGGNPFYTPEPDICHELIGHVPLFLNPAFADFSQEIGLASLGASDDDIGLLSSLYWFTVEFGVIRAPNSNNIKAYGAGVLSSFGEIEWACSEKPSQECLDSGGITANYPHMKRPEYIPFDPWIASTTPFPITTYQPKFFVREKMLKYFIFDFFSSKQITIYINEALKFHSNFKFCNFRLANRSSILRIKRASSVTVSIVHSSHSTIPSPSASRWTVR